MTSTSTQAVLYQKAWGRTWSLIFPVVAPTTNLLLEQLSEGVQGRVHGGGQGVFGGHSLEERVLAQQNV